MNWKSRARRLLGRTYAPPVPVGLDALEKDWTFRPSTPDAITLWRRWRQRANWRATPAMQAIRPVAPHRRWIAYFIYLPDGGLTPAHRYTLDRLRAAQDAAVMVICAAPDAAAVPTELRGMTDALYWKALNGFDFSAYAIAVHEIARRSSGADLLMINDSVYGPFVPVDTLWPQMRWDLTGFSASGQDQNHIQSYAFCLRDVDESRAAALHAIFPEGCACDDYRAVVLNQETRFASVADRTMSVGALWYGAPERCLDPSLFAALSLVEAGFPFLKRGLLTKHSGVYDKRQILETMRSFNHPVDQ